MWSDGQVQATAVSARGWLGPVPISATNGVERFAELEAGPGAALRELLRSVIKVPTAFLVGSWTESSDSGAGLVGDDVTRGLKFLVDAGYGARRQLEVSCKLSHRR